MRSATTQALPAWHAGNLERIGVLNDWVQLTRESAEMRLQTQQMGRSLAEWLKNRQPPDERVARLAALPPAPTWPVAFALAISAALAVFVGKTRLIDNVILGKEAGEA